VPTTESPTLEIGINLVAILEITRQTLHIPIYLQDVKITERALIDSGAGANLISKELAANLQLSLTEL
jgi:hypothetical protein